MKNKTKKTKAFTLIELLAVLFILFGSMITFGFVVWLVWYNFFRHV